VKTFAEGNILKMKTLLEDVVQYKLPIGHEEIEMNKFIGQRIKLSFNGQINCIATGEKIKKSYNQGYSYKAFMTLARCDLCIVKPELCHYHKGTCREPKWGEENCFQPHIIYLAISSGVKVGITREKQVPTRWMDQGAIKALPILKVESRRDAGMIETAMKEQVSDRTNWRKMLQDSTPEKVEDLVAIREGLFESYADLIDDYNGEDIDENIVEINYPVESYPQKITSLGFDKNPEIQGELQGIKGQYLIFDTGVVNIRKHQGYWLKLESEE
jgi:hypothetical protein